MREFVPKQTLFFLVFLLICCPIFLIKNYCYSIERERAQITNIQDLIDLPRRVMGQTQESVIEKWGLPQRSEAKKAKNLHVKNVYDLYQCLTYEGIQVVIFRSGYAEDREFLSAVTLQKNIVLLDLPIRIGDSASDIKRLLGEPDEMDEHRLVYLDLYSEGPGSDRIDFSFEGDTVKQIQWQYFLD